LARELGLFTVVRFHSSRQVWAPGALSRTSSGSVRTGANEGIGAN